MVDMYKYSNSNDKIPVKIIRNNIDEFFDIEVISDNKESDVSIPLKLIQEYEKSISYMNYIQNQLRGYYNND